MKFNRYLSLLTLCAIVALSACQKREAQSEQAADGTPHGAAMAVVDAMRAGDFMMFLRATLSEAELAEAEQEWTDARAGAMDPEDEAELNALLARLNQDDAVDIIMADIEPRLREVQAQLPLLLGIAQTVGHASIANNEALNDEQKTAANELLGAMGRWAGGRDLADPELARKAVSVAVQAGRSLELESAGDLQELEFAEMIQRASVLLRASKDMLAVYGIDINAMLDSVTAETLLEEGDEALVRLRFRFLDTDQKIDVPMIRREGRWYSEDAISDEDEQDDEDALASEQEERA